MTFRARSQTDRGRGRGRAALWSLLSGVVGAVVTRLAGCTRGPIEIPDAPELPLHHWQAGRLESADTGQRYDYIEHAGPRPDAPVVLLVHGAFLDHRIWLNFDGLARTHRLIALRWPDASALYRGRLADHVEMLADFARSMGLRKFVLGGVSFGGSVAVEFAASRSREFELSALVLVATALWGSSRGEIRGRMAFGRLTRALQDEHLLRLIARVGGRQRFESVERSPQAEELFYLRPVTYYRQLFAALYAYGDGPQPGRCLTLPTLLLHGTKDDTIAVERAREALTMIPGAELEEYSGWTHALAFLHGRALTDRIEIFLEAGR